MNETILVALIGTIGVVIGATLTFLASYFTGKQKLQEIELSYRQKLDENYLANARLHIGTLYLPINISLSKLADRYEYYTNLKKSLKENERMYKSFQELGQSYRDITSHLQEMMHKELIAAKQAASDFKVTCKDHIALMSEIASQGEDAYLITKLEEHLRSFTYFLKASLEDPTYEEVDHTIFEDELQYNKEHSSIGSSRFEQRFLSDMHEIKTFIKEVTLGTKTSNKN